MWESGSLVSKSLISGLFSTCYSLENESGKLTEIQLETILTAALEGCQSSQRCYRQDGPGEFLARD